MGSGEPVALSGDPRGVAHDGLELLADKNAPKVSENLRGVFVSVLARVSLLWAKPSSPIPNLRATECNRYFRLIWITYLLPTEIENRWACFHATDEVSPWFSS